ncbi:MAG: hypothetical protein R2824_08475 [Saprospiraceae bacterium]
MATSDNVPQRLLPWWLILLQRALGFIFGSMTLSQKIFLRKDLGIGTYGIPSLILAYAWVRYFLLGKFHFYARQDFEPTGSNWDAVREFLHIGFGFFWQFWTNIKYWSEALWPVPQFPYKYSLAVLIYSFVMLGLAVGYWLNAREQRKKRIPHDNKSKGESFFFPILVKKKVFGPDSKHYVNFMECLLSFLVGVIVYRTLGDQIGLYLICTSFLLFFEDFIQYKQEQAQVQASIDARFQAEKFREKLKEYDQRE